MGIIPQREGLMIEYWKEIGRVYKSHKGTLENLMTFEHYRELN